MLGVNALISYKNHPFALYKGERMQDMADSISEYGIITPIIVRPHPDEEGKSVGICEIPAVINESLTDDEAALIVT